MKRLSSYIATIITLFVISCSDKIGPAIEPELSYQLDSLIITTKSLEFDCDSNQYILAIKANCNYEVVITEDWIHYEINKSLYNDSITLNISPNTTYNPRRCDIIIQATEIAMSDTIQIIQEEGFNSLAKALKADKSITLFYQAMVLTGMIDSIRGYIDETFVSKRLDQDMISYGGSNFEIFYNNNFLTKYTVFCEKDSMLKEKHNIQTLADFKDFAKKIYDTSFPADAGKYDNDYTNPHNPLNRYISYHILPMGLNYEQMNPSGESIKQRFIKWDEIDFEDFFSPMLKHSILKISTPYQSKVRYLNRKGSAVNGIEIYPEGIEASNGYVYYISDALSYSMEVRKDVMNTRIRVLSSSLFPEIMSNGARDYSHEKDFDFRYSVLSFNDEHKRSYLMSDSTSVYLRKPSDIGLSYMGEDVIIGLQFDFCFKLPSVPVDGLYEIRIRHRFGFDNPDEVHFYLNGEQCGCIKQSDQIMWNSLWKSDWDLENNDSLINVCDDSLRLNRYMKDVASYTISSDDLDETCRNYSILGRYIICSDYYMETNKDYYLRIKRVDKDRISYDYYGNPYLDTRMIRLDMLEIVPKYIYDGSEREDKY